MKFSILAFLSLIFVFEASAQRYNNPGSRRDNGTGRPSHGGGGSRINNGNNGGRINNGPVIIRNDRRDRVIISTRRDSRPVRWVGPRYNPPGRFGRSYRTVIRDWRWTPTNYLACDYSNTLRLNGNYIHDFMFNSDCQQAIYDIQNYGDFCDNSDLYDQSGMLEAQFSWESECREALGWYY